ncbi:MAG: hypothetical protein TH68_06765 [Candidatus Synechococcus spongiarum 142]|uniref:DNA methylase N-4/N-6 domain-containing protein n=1 Tax=Candidatus Synechococcus spongiarum 142 TaxID=1608213 RepID=A0A6N3X2Z9_9SYNE|nr:MAG: hypothetical protein TH68_06765 [Candidatus Synechococcus spongiarum 142]
MLAPGDKGMLRGQSLMPKPNFVSATIWAGNNLDIMRGMNSACVDLIYLDPPFNSSRHPGGARCSAL